jgi:hypothetical protein
MSDYGLLPQPGGFEGLGLAEQDSRQDGPLVSPLSDYPLRLLMGASLSAP